MRVARTVLLSLCLTLLLGAALAAPAGAAVVKGTAHGAKRLSSPVTLPNGKQSRFTFTLRRPGGALVTGYAVTGTRFYVNLNLGGYYRASRIGAFHDFRRGYAGGARFRYSTVSGGGSTYLVLSRVYYLVFGE